MNDLKALMKVATSANERPHGSEEIGRYMSPGLGWLTLYREPEGGIKYVTDHMLNFNKMMEAADRRHKKEKRQTR